MVALVHAIESSRETPPAAKGFYAEVARTCQAWLAEAPERPFFLGIQGPQGAGKSSLAAALVDAFATVGTRSVALSIDDFYLTREEQLALCRSHPGSRVLEHRGAPGTHDVALGTQVLEGLRTLGDGDELRLPRYDKSAHEGRGDRAPEASWKRATGPLHLVILEGWTLGFEPVADAACEGDLRPVNDALPAYRAWTRALSGFLMLDAAELDDVVAWRVEAENVRRARGEGALSSADARDYIERFRPVYRAYLPGLRARPPCPRSRRFVLGRSRLPARVEEELGFPAGEAGLG